MPLTTVGNIIYNGVEFGSLHKSEVSATPEYDESGRVVKWVRYTIKVDAWIGANLPVDTELENIRVKLTKPGQTLFYNGKGFGNNFIVNRVGPPFDVNWGPKPTLLTWRPLAGRQGAFLTWQVETCIPECPETARYQGIVTVNYEVQLAIDQDDYTTRTVTGHVIIAQTRQAFSNRVKETAEAYREQITPAEIRGFQRVTRDFKLSKDRNRGDFTFVDKELPVPLPDRVKTIQVEQSLSSDRQKGFRNWVVRFNGSGNCAAGTPKSTVFDAFYKTVLARLNGVLFAIQGRQFPDQKNAGKSAPFAIFPMSFSAREQIYGKESNFEATYMLIGPGRLEAVLSSRMFTAIVQNNHGAWQKSLENNAEIGYAKLRVPGNDEVLIDLCTLPKPTTLKTGGGTSSRTSTLTPGIFPEDPGALAPQRRSPGTPAILKATSWLSYECDLRTVTTNQIAVHKRLPEEDPKRYRKSDKGSLNPTTSSGEKLAKADGDRIPEVVAKTDDVIQVLASPSYEFWLIGEAERIEHQVAVPRLASVNGVEAVQLSADVRHFTSGSVGDIPIHKATWSIRYQLVRKYDGEVPEAGNPALKTDGDVA